MRLVPPGPGLAGVGLPWARAILRALGVGVEGAGADWACDVAYDEVAAGASGRAVRPSATAATRSAGAWFAGGETHGASSVAGGASSALVRRPSASAAPIGACRPAGPTSSAGRVTLSARAGGEVRSARGRGVDDRRTSAPGRRARAADEGAGGRSAASKAGKGSFVRAMAWHPLAGGHCPGGTAS